MALSADNLLDRINLKQQIRKWRLAAIFLAVLLLLVMVGKFAGGGLKEGYIARVEVEDIITADIYRDQVLKDLRDNKQVKAVIVYINSPGGTIVGGETLYKSLQAIRAVKPVVAVMGTVAASGGYMVAIAADQIFAQEGTITGSIGVLLQTAEATDLANKVGVNFITFKSAPLKGTPSPFEKLTPEAVKAINDGIQDAYEQFVDMVVARRTQLSREQIVKLADGRVYTGRQALKEKLIDAIGNEETALAWLQDVKKINISRYKVKKVSTEEPREGLEQLLSSFSGGLLPVSKAWDSQGIMALWKPGII